MSSETLAGAATGAMRRTAAIRFLWGGVALLFLLGGVDYLLLQAGLGAVYAEAIGILEAALGSSSRMLLGLTVTKGLVAAFSSVEINLLVAQATLGALLNGVGEVVDTLFRFFLASTALIVGQIGLLTMLQFVGMKLLLGGGALLMALAPDGRSWMVRLGRLGLVSGLVLCILFPLLIVAGAKGIEQHQVISAIENAENLGVLKEQFSDVSIRDLARAEGIAAARDTLQTGVQTVWKGMLALFVSYFMMFVILPLISLGVCYLVIRHAMVTEGFAAGADAADRWLLQVRARIAGKKNDAAPAGAAEGTA